MQLGHAPVVDVLAAAHRVGEVHLPAVAVVDVGERRGDAAFGHDGVRLAEQRLADQADLDAGRRRLDRRAQTGAAGADDENVVVREFQNPWKVSGDRRREGHRIRRSVQMPIEQSRT